MSDYGFIHEGKVFTPNGTADVVPSDNDERNKAIERAELEAWQARPERFVAYYHFPTDSHTTRSQGVWRGEPTGFTPRLDGAHVTTWLGTRLGTITSARVYRHNFGGRFVSMRVKGSNGAEYHGRASWDWGTVIRLRRVK